MRMSVKTQEQYDRVEKAFSFINSKFQLDLNFIILPMTPGKLKRYSKTFFTIERSNREKQDRNTFLIYFNQDFIAEATKGKLLRHCLHEIFHAVTWPFVDEFEEVTKYLDKNAELYNELHKRAKDTRENVIYALERKLGPHLLPEANWNGEDD
jgi:hypothetical protein